MDAINNKVTELWDKYHVSDIKRNHMRLVASVAVFFAKKLKEKSIKIAVNEPLLETAALLHDLDKNVPGLPGETHPDTGVRLLREEGMNEVADVVKAHSLHAILSSKIAPQTWEEKLLYLADKMVKHSVITVDKRFKLWNDEHLPEKEQKILDMCYPKVKALEADIFMRIGMEPDKVAGELTG